MQPHATGFPADRADHIVVKAMTVAAIALRDVIGIVACHLAHRTGDAVEISHLIAGTG
jgi:ubiquinone biosynthesis protein Coq4